MKREFKVGDRVRVYDGGHSRRGTVSEPSEGPHPGESIWVVYDKPFYGVLAGDRSPQQCRRLKPKPKVKKEARTVWVTFRNSAGDECCDDVFMIRTEPDAIEFREVLPGEVVVTRETLAKAYRDAWSQIPLNEDTSNETMISLIAKALGLES